jgi:hypothetical protein
MAVQRIAPQASVAEVLDRVLDRGIVIDAWLRVSVAGITVIDIDARVVVASIETYVQQGEAVAQAALASRPAALPAARPARRPRVRLQCESGCTFFRPAQRCPASVRCPFDRSRACPVTAIPRPA